MSSIGSHANNIIILSSLLREPSSISSTATATKLERTLNQNADIGPISSHFVLDIFMWKCINKMAKTYKYNIKYI